MSTQFATSTDGMKIAYDLTGSGPFVILLHGGGPSYSRQSWHEVGYVTRLASQYSVITIDIRGHGESDAPIEQANYTIDQMCADILTVADACGAKRFMLWGFSFGGNIGRFLIMKSDRVNGLIVIGIPFGPAADGEFRQFILDFRAKWRPIIEQSDLSTLSDSDREAWKKFNIPTFVAWLSAMLDWGVVEPADLTTPTLWLSGTNNENTIQSIQQYRGANTLGQLEVITIDSLNHQQEFSEIEQIFPYLIRFTQKYA